MAYLALCVAVSLTSMLACSLEDQDGFNKETNVRMVALFDNEEVGSASDRGADSNMMLARMSQFLLVCMCDSNH